MDCKKIALIFQGTVSNDARVRREVESISQFAKIDVFSSHVADHDAEYFNENVRLIPFELFNSWISTNLNFAKQFVRVKELLNPFDYDAVICIDYPTLKAGVEMKRQNPEIKLIYDSHEIYIETINQFFPRSGFRSIYGVPLTILNKILHGRSEKKMVKNADICVTVCDSLKQYFESLWLKRVYVLKNCPHLASLALFPKTENPYIKQYGCNENDIILLYQGNINHGRGLFHLINSMPFLPSFYKLFIIGSGTSKNDLELLTQSLKLDNVYFIDRLPYEELFNFTRYSHLGISLIEPINLSKKLSLPNKLFEYMYVGIPFLSSDLPEPVSLLKIADAGYICSGFEPETIKMTIEKIFASPELYKTKANNGIKAIQDHLNWEKEFSCLMDQIKETKEIID